MWKKNVPNHQPDIYIILHETVALKSFQQALGPWDTTDLQGPVVEIPAASFRRIEANALQIGVYTMVNFKPSPIIKDLG